MNVYKSKNIVSLVSSGTLALLGIIMFSISKSSISNIISIALFILAIIGFSNYYKYSIILDKEELRITKVFKGKKIKYKDIIKIFTVQAGKTYVTYIVDKYYEGGKCYIRGTYPPQQVEQLNKAEFNNLSELLTVNSYAFKKYKQFLLELSRKVNFSCDIDTNTWKVINK